MTLISIRERSITHPGSVVVFDNQEEYPCATGEPFSEPEEKLLAWYFEEWLRFPFTDQVKAQQAAESITRYGQALFRKVFDDAEAFARYKIALQQGLDSLQWEVAGNPEFHRLHWETLWDPKLPRPFVLEGAFVRKNLTPSPLRAPIRPGPTINLLIVTARPRGRLDVGYRTISRPLVEALRQAGIPVQVDILRPGTYKALLHHLEDFAGEFTWLC